MQSNTINTNLVTVLSFQMVLSHRQSPSFPLERTLHLSSPRMHDPHEQYTRTRPVSSPLSMLLKLMHLTHLPTWG